MLCCAITLEQSACEANYLNATQFHRRVALASPFKNFHAFTLHSVHLIALADQLRSDEILPGLACEG